MQRDSSSEANKKCLNPGDPGFKQPDHMSHIQFHPELFDHRSDAIDALAAAGFHWLVDYTAVDLDHERFGIEVCGIPEKAMALRIRRVLHAAFPAWRYSVLFEKDWGTRDLGWCVEIHRDREVERTW